MLQSHALFHKGVDLAIADAHQIAQNSFTLPVSSKALVDDLIAKGLQAGGKEPTKTIKEDFMIVRNLQDPDGHNWAIMYLDLEKFKTLKDI